MTHILSDFHFRNELWVLIIPVALMAIDFATGLFHAWSTNSFKSKKMRAGLSKKTGEIAILIIGELFSFGMRIPGYIMDGISAYIIFMEFMSVMENCKKMGVPIPGFVSKALNTIDEALKEEDVAEAVKKVAELEKEVEELKKLSSD